MAQKKKKNQTQKNIILLEILNICILFQSVNVLVALPFVETKIPAFWYYYLFNNN